MPLCDTLMRIAEAGLYRIHFSQEILDGATRNLIRNGRMDEAKASRFQTFLLTAFPEALVEIPDGLTAVMTNDLGDRHVLAAAVVCRAEIIVTFNLKDFQPAALARWNIEAQHPDAFLVDLCDYHGVEPLARVIQEQAAALKRPPATVLELLEKLHASVSNFAIQITSALYSREVEAIAKKILDSPFAEKPAFNRRSYSGSNYELHQINKNLSIVSKDGRGKILTANLSGLTALLMPQDVRRFQEFNMALEDCLSCKH